jgi:putative DNA primase/helicase
MVPGIVPVAQPLMERELGRSADWCKWDEPKGKSVTVDPPAPVAAQILSMAGHWPFEPLHGIVQCPTLRSDGSLLYKEGYDVNTGLVLVNNVTIPPISTNPSKAEAAAALELLLALVRGFPFVDAESTAVALSMMITPVVRGGMTVAPMHLVSAPLPGTGKSYLLDCASMIAAGEVCAVEAMAPKYEETEKRLVGSALSGFPIIAVDNVREIVAGDFFCQVTERPLMSLRALGSSDKHRIPNTFTVFANGNNATVAGDMVRRTIRSEMDANTESPEQREFEFDPLAEIQQDRGKYIKAALTIPLAYIAAGGPRQKTPLASFTGWSRIVRDPLLWLGCADPVSSQVKLRITDPVRENRGQVFKVWRNEFHTNQPCTVPEIAEAADARHTYDQSFVRPAFHAALLAVAASRANPAQVDPRRLGIWLKKNENTIADQCKLVVDRSDERRPRWQLIKP